MNLNQLIGAVSLIVLIILFIILLTAIYPKIFLRFGYSKNIPEGKKSSDNSFYLPNEKYAHVIEKYELVKNYKTHKKYAVITLKPNIDVASFGIYSFNIKGRCYDYMKVNFSAIDNQVVIELKDDTYGLNIFPLSYNSIDVDDFDESGIRVFRSRILGYSITTAITCAVFSFLLTISLAFINMYDDPLHIFSLLNIGIYILMFLLVMILSGVGSYFVIFLTNRRYIDEAVYE